MIEKLIKLRGIGLLHDAVSRGIQFSKITIIYGENGRGKTTLATIFSSLAQNDPSMLKGRTTLDGTQGPNIEFRINSTSYTYSSGTWNQCCNNIVVFDSRFVDSNVYSGFEISADHRQSLLTFTLGEEGGALKNEVDNINEQILGINAQIRSRRGILENICQPQTIEEYIRIPQDPDIDRKIRDIEAFYLSVQRTDKICRNSPLSEIDIPSLNFDYIRTLMQISLSDISEDTKARVIEHMNAHMEEQNESWIKEGLCLIKEEGCPFCGQDLNEAKSIIELYQRYFDESYQEHQTELQNQQSLILKRLSDSLISDLIHIYNNNQSLYDNTWKDFLNVEFGYLLSIEEVSDNLEEIRESVGGLFQIKLSKPANKIENLEFYDLITRKYLDISGQLQKYNQEVRTVNANIENIKYRLKQANQQQIKKDLERLEKEKERHSSPNKEICEEFERFTQEKADLEERKRIARNQLETFTNDLLEQYEEDINRYLDSFNAGFGIINVDTSHERGIPRMKYQLLLRNQNLPITSQREASDRPGFSNTLSEGDKRTLAFSFYMAKNDLDTNISNKILIVDDPMSSLDQSRQRATQIALKNIAQRANQLIVLSHDPNFLKSLIDIGDFNQADLSAFELKRAQDDYSTLEKCDIEECIQSVYKTNYQLISRYISDPRGIDRISVVRAIRPMLEANLRHRFQDALKATNSLGKMIELIRASSGDNPLVKIQPHLQIIEEINAYTTSHTHDTNAEGLLPQINDAELKRYAVLALNIAQGF